MCSRISHFLKMLSWLKCWYRVDFHQVFVWRSVYLGTLSSIGGKTKWRPWWIWGKGLLLSDIWLQIQSDLEVAVGLNLDRFKCWIWNVEEPFPPFPLKNVLIFFRGSWGEANSSKLEKCQHLQEVLVLSTEFRGNSWNSDKLSLKSAEKTMNLPVNLQNCVKVLANFENVLDEISLTC